MADVNALSCPRCRCIGNSTFRRESLHSNSSFLPLKKRGKVKIQRVVVHCTWCGYHWRSTHRDAAKLEQYRGQ